MEEEAEMHQVLRARSGGGKRGRVIGQGGGIGDPTVGGGGVVGFAKALGTVWYRGQTIGGLPAGLWLRRLE